MRHPTGRVNSTGSTFTGWNQLTTTLVERMIAPFLLHGPAMNKQSDREIMFSVLDNIKNTLNDRKIYYKLNAAEKYILDMVTKTLKELK